MAMGVFGWAVTLAVGIGLGLLTRASVCVGARTGLWWAAVLAGLAGAVAGRLVIDVAFSGWHSPFLGGVFGALFLSFVWAAAMRITAPPTGN
ncbi:MAG TPA: hypothetical protein VM221_09365 [Armatimonadota bacterium]|nr:hypothetical protein [Armatimonadota bacterium]